MALNQPAEAISALDASSLTAQRPGLLFFAGRRTRRRGSPFDAASDYEMLYTRFTLSEQAREAATKLDFLQGSAAGQIPAIPYRPASGPRGDFL